MKSLLFVFCYCCLNSLHAQTLNNFSLKDIGNAMVMVTDGNGKLVNMGLDMENYGTPFFDSDFYPADITLVSGQRYENVQTKINLLSNEVIFKADDGKELAILPAIQSVVLKKDGVNAVFEFGYPSFEKQTSKTIYQVLSKGEVTVLKYFFVQVTEAKPYSSATMLRTIEKFPKLLVYSKKIGINAAPKTTQEVEALFKEDAAKLNSIVSSNNLKIKKEADLVKCFEIFNQFLVK